MAQPNRERLAGALAVAGYTVKPSWKIPPWLPAIAWGVVIIIATSIPGDLGAGPPGADKLAHFLIYGVLGILVGPWIAASRWRWRRPAAVVFMLAFAAVDELHQLYIPGRAAEFGDFVADACGALAGLACGSYFGLHGKEGS